MISDLEMQGGAAIAAGRLADGLVAGGDEVFRFVKFPQGGPHRWTTRLLGGRTRDRFTWGIVEKAARRVSLRLEAWTQRVGLLARLRRELRRLRPDAISVHNIAHAGWWPDLVRICQEEAPTVWTLHDMWSFTGRCGYRFDCAKFRTGCDAACPTAHEYPALAPDRIRTAWAMKKRALSESPALVAACPSRWLAAEARDGFWSGHRVEVIPYGLPVSVYEPIGRPLAREALGIQCEGPVLLFAADVLGERRKGGELLLEALSLLPRRPLTVLTLGHGEMPVRGDRIRHVPLGYIGHERTKALAYASADALVHPALADNLPLVALEAVACGTPVVAYAVGGLPEIVRPGVTGWLANSVTARGLADAILAGLEDRSDLRDSCRRVAVTEYSSEIQAGRYRALFASLGARR